MSISAQTFISILTFAAVIHIVLGAVAYLIYVERKMAAYIQDRIGPNRVGFDFGLPGLKFLRGMLGLGQPLADGLKFLLKEDYAPDKVDKVLFTLAPMAIIIPALIGFAIIPWGGEIRVPSFSILGLLHVEGGPAVVAGLHANIGIVYVLAVASLGVYGVTLAGYASNNKYSFLGGLRATAQMVSYEIPLGLSIMAALLLVGSLMPQDIIDHQREHGWLLFAQPVAAVLFFIAILAEANRAPFDVAEAEQELVGGYHTEYSSMRFALFFLAEYGHMVTSCAMFTLLFLGGWEPLPFISVFGAEAVTVGGGLMGVLGGLALVGAKLAVFLGKALTLVAFMMLIRWTIPRLRYDQIMMGAWQNVIPLSLAVVVVTSIMVYLRLDGLVPMFIANVAIFGLLMLILPILPKHNPNRKIPIYGSRFSPMPGEKVVTGVNPGLAREDHPVHGTVQV
ncbi:MAG: NADH-quinone oxidoreductase subunit NuoH [Phycisphaeraceae bacterium]|nr:NADH-quinone oxidoreductase subunit NuoH [Phycisphaeraceae bacterium]MCW5755498.1 NADH-quinone oxidoreductase subunit NuoH [Phycisphaeraceae bacterium]